MPRICLACLATAALALSGCSGANGLNVGTDPNAGPNGSYSGYTLNSPVTDQNPHVGGGDPSYPSTVSDQGVVPPPPDKVNGR